MSNRNSDEYNNDYLLKDDIIIDNVIFTQEYLFCLECCVKLAVYNLYELKDKQIRIKYAKNSLEQAKDNKKLYEIKLNQSRNNISKQSGDNSEHSKQCDYEIWISERKILLKYMKNI
ncbi:hypothetical protein Hokovirus_1_336 [Hokovirus HKV1]|uniref:Uncharacterized protein n=1 Tax=Hokovirus HKV1 TaxID=1977638 RepID=A0A1V0SFG2_9VIRU|nr:hypothetical protein Hokovirus_1_336 [Hokovirus HKV1]